MKNYVPEFHWFFSSGLGLILRILHWLHAEVYVHKNQCMGSHILPCGSPQQLCCPRMRIGVDVWGPHLVQKLALTHM